jgi:hypothetical protein
MGIRWKSIWEYRGKVGLGFVVTINTAKKLLLDRPSFWSGLEGHLISGSIAQILNVPQPMGYLVRTVAKGSAGEAVGLMGGAVLATIMEEQLVVGGDMVPTRPSRQEGVDRLDTQCSRRHGRMSTVTPTTVGEA